MVRSHVHPFRLRAILRTCTTDLCCINTVSQGSVFENENERCNIIPCQMQAAPTPKDADRRTNVRPRNHTGLLRNKQREAAEVREIEICWDVRLEAIDITRQR
jgi:hypothetical protein